jgi:hypothetical protein
MSRVPNVARSWWLVLLISYNCFDVWKCIRTCRAHYFDLKVHDLECIYINVYISNTLQILDRYNVKYTTAKVNPVKYTTVKGNITESDQIKVDYSYDRKNPLILMIGDILHIHVYKNVYIYLNIWIYIYICIYVDTYTCKYMLNIYI